MKGDIDADTSVRVLPPKKPKALLRLIHSDSPFTCTAIPTGKEWELETGDRTKILTGEATQQSLRTDRLTAGDQRNVAAASRSVNVLSPVVTKKHTLVKVRRGATIVASGKSTRRAVVLGRNSRSSFRPGATPCSQRRSPSSPPRSAPSKSSSSRCRRTRTRHHRLSRSRGLATHRQSDRRPSHEGRRGRDDIQLRARQERLPLVHDPVPGRRDETRPSHPRRQGNRPTGNTRTSAYSWKVDSSQIAFMSDRDGNLELYAMEPDGTKQVRLTTNPAADEDPDWSPDRRRIVFHSDRDGNAICTS